MSDNKTARRVLIVDDEPDIRELLGITLSRMDITCTEAGDLQQARDALSRETFQLCLVDMRLPDGNGIDLIRHIQRTRPNLPVAMITAHGNMQSAIDALKAGAFDFLNKPVELPTLRNLVRSALLLGEQTESDEAPASNDCLQLLGHSAPIESIRHTIRKLARSQAPVYISGESGTGKELVARLIHAQGPRAEQPFVAVNCGAIPAELMESELFGYKKGSFTGAYADKEGLFQCASGGTLFLDEVADLPLDMQVKLLRAIQEKVVRPVGSQTEVHVDVRILSATHKDLSEQVAVKRFREDLYYRINVIELHVPSLRERPEDIPLLADHFIQQLAQKMAIPAPELSAGASADLLKYSFPGNVRQLENILERALTLCEGAVIESDDLLLEKNNHHEQPPITPVAQLISSPFDLDELIPDETLVEQVGLEAYLESIERKLINDALQNSGNNKTAAAKRLGISFRALRYRLKKLEME
ncbi:sigma-54-dependent transcriptional regulator [Nitrincola alkalilacustris]|uniref:sigma-54-dependent transcriptional regulator n=1 Tax=Nitrincola alkalilacustris TaxID=1571224 RepID=UPI00124EDE31|nr:sigma-54 dependent transcriptional regulator [Nitrincola alkalilacustris]